MGANSTQAIAVLLFLVGFTVLAGGFAGGGIPLTLLGLVLIGVSCFFFMKCKTWENKRPIRQAWIDSRRNQMTIAGIVVTFAGFLIALFSVGMTADNTMRLIIVLVGIAVSLIGIIGVLNRACLSNAIWKK